MCPVQWRRAPACSHVLPLISNNMVSDRWRRLNNSYNAYDLCLSSTFLAGIVNDECQPILSLFYFRILALKKTSYYLFGSFVIRSLFNYV
ncbi:unnamed protein product [Brugia timori]|uniref:Secreted protein n=1 Tax=Brugia timori TaxID=42155 RepID=A0A0R3Q365_9BILA|nr:unnamed protein product [Brugia timori]